MCQVIKMMKEVEIGHYVALKTEEDVPDPWYIAQVIDRDDDNNLFKIHWFKPTSALMSRTHLYESMYYEEEWDSKKIKGYQRGKKYRLIPRMQYVNFDQCYFGFTKLKSSGGLPAEVQRQLKQLGLITGKIKRS